MKLVNKKAYFEYHVLDTWVAGIVLQGTEIKSIRENNVNFADSFAYINNGEIFVKGIHIAPYEYEAHYNHVSDRERKLLLKKKEIKKIGASLEKGITLKVLSVFTTERGLCKVTLGLCRGKRLVDKREVIKARDIERENQNLT